MMDNTKISRAAIPIMLLLLIFTNMQTHTIFNFKPNADITNWTVVNDVVMGGESAAKININTEGHGVFEGHVSLENNGGFSSLRYRFDAIDTKPFSKIILKIKGDGKKYQFRIKSKSSDSFSYVQTFKSSGEWENIEVLMANMEPKFRGRKLDMLNYSDVSIQEIAFLIGNKKEEDFKIIIDKISLK